MDKRYRTPIFCAAIGVALLAGAAAGSRVAAQSKPAPVASLNAREVNIVDDKGNVRLRLGAPLPMKIPQGGERRNPIYGIQFIDPAVGEVGGIVMIDKIGVRGLCWDYGSYAGEAVCFSLIKGQPRISVNDDKNERIGIGLSNGLAEVVINGGDGNPRVKLAVDKQGHAQLEGMGPAR
jgi:hypothetical protein